MMMKYFKTLNLEYFELDLNFHKHKNVLKFLAYLIYI